MFETEYKAAFSHVTAPQDTLNRVMNMAQEGNTGRKKMGLRLMLVAVILISAMALVGAYSGFVLYTKPQDMLEALMGVNGCSSYTSHEVMVLNESGYPIRIENPAGTRTELDMELAKKWIAPYIYRVGERIVDGDTVLTAEACLIDRATHTAALYLKLENSPSYDVSSRGQLWWLNENDEFFYYPNVSLIGQDFFLLSYLIAEEMTTDDTLAMILMFTCDEGSEGMILTAGESGKSITIPFPEETGMEHLELAEGKIVLSPFGAMLDSGTFGIRFWTNDIISIRYKSGEEYLLHWEDPAWKQYESAPVPGEKILLDEDRMETWESLKDPIYNSNFSVFLDEENSSVVYIFNRVLDLDEVKSVVINGVEYPVQ